MNKLVTTLTAAGLMISANAALAGKESGSYIGLSLAKSSYDVVNDGNSLDEDDASYKIFGGYNFGLVPLFDVAAEISYVDFGSMPIDNEEQSSSALTAFGLGAYNMGPFAVFAKYGLAKFEGDLSDETNGAYGLGARVQLGSLAARAEYEKFELTDNAEVDYISLGISWTF